MFTSRRNPPASCVIATVWVALIAGVPGCSAAPPAPEGNDAPARATPTSKISDASTQADPFAPPTDDQVRRDAQGKKGGVLEVKLSDKPGKKVWSSAHKQYFWEKAVVVKRDANLAQFPQAKLLVTGFVRYEITGGKYVYREFKVAENEYEGIPRPSDEEAVRIVKQHLADFLRGPFNSMVNTDKIKLEIARPDEQKWVWHSPESVEFRVRVSYDTIVSATEVASIQSVWDARLYRDKVDQPWQRITGSERTRTEVSRRKYTAKQIRDLPTGLAR